MVPAVEAATFVVPSDRALVNKAKGIVSGTIIETHSETSPGGFPVTISKLSVEEVIKGNLAVGETIELSELGGESGELMFVVPGSPAYTPGERALVFLERNSRGSWSTLDMALGRFSHVVNRKGERLLVRDEHAITGWDTRGRPWEEKSRKADAFLDFVRGAAQGRAVPEDYFSDSDAADAGTDEPASVGAAANGYPGSAYASKMTMNSVTRPVRWPSFGSGVVLRSRGSQPGYADGGVGAVQAAAGSWTNDPASNVNYQCGGATTATYGLNEFDTVNSVQFNDPNNEIAGSFTGSGTLGIGGYWSNGQTHLFAGETFYNIIQVDVVIQDGVGTYLSSNRFNQLVTHEVGHTLGLRHSDQGTPSTTAAIMRASLVTEYGATLQQYDRDAVQTLYASGTTAPVALSATAISPSHGVATGVTITISGSGFQSGATVTVNGVAASNVSVASSTSINARTPSLLGGTIAAVVVRNPDGGSATVPTRFFANYGDVAESHPQRAYIEAASRYGVTSGCGNGNYCPASPITRAEMSVFILRGKHGATYVPPAATGRVFIDNPTTAFAAAWIERMAAEGITSGCRTSYFCPGSNTTRGQMMVFLVSAKYGAGYSPAAAVGVYADVPVTHLFARFIEKGWFDGFAGTCGSGTFCPDRDVTRAEMAEFVVKAFGIPLS